MMSKILKKKWLNALRSGKFKQGRAILRNKNGEYCCLGVLCAIRGDWRPIEDGEGVPRTDYNNDEPLSYCGLRPVDIKTLVNLNDSKQYSFKMIAAWISKNIKTKK